ncbi:MAG: helical backbone metal receptor [Schleiferiaceae bacterium]
MKITDPTGHTIEMPSAPMRIASWVPSQTEYLVDLGLRDQIVGVTKFCIHPSDLLTRENNIGGTKKIWREKLLELQPDLVIANKEENTLEDVEWAREHFPTYTTDVVDIPSALSMLQDLANLCGVSKMGTSWVEKIELEFESLNLSAKASKTPTSDISEISTLYLIWKNPYMAAGTDTFIHSVLDWSGLKNAIEKPRYPEISIEEINTMRPSLILLSSEPFPFSDKHIVELKNQLDYEPVISVVDGEMFSWYGSRLLKTPMYISQFLSSKSPIR